MKRLLLLLCFAYSVSSTLAYAQSLRLGIPKKHPAPIYKFIKTELESRGYIEGKNLSIIEFNLPSTTREEIENSVDIFYSSGDRIKFLYKIQPKTPILFLTMQGSFKIPATMEDNVTGVYRTAKTVKALENMKEIVVGATKPVFIYRAKSGLEKSKKRYFKAAKKLSFKMGFESYTDKNDLEALFKRIKGKYDVIFTFPPSVSKPLIPQLINLQNKYKIPVISQVSSYVKQGLVAGSTADYENISVKLVDYMESILNGQKPGNLPASYFSPKNYVNLNTANQLNIELNSDFIEQSTIIKLNK